VTLRVGVVGAGLWAERAHLPAFARAEGAEVVAISDADLPRAQALARDFSISRAFSDYRDLLDHGIDAVSIVAPDDVHHEVAGAALRAGLPVLCEKPLARTIEEAEDLARLAESAGAITKMGFVFRYSPALQHLRQLVTEGYVGRVHSLASYSQNAQFMDPSAPLHWKMQRARTGGGVFVEYGSHSIDLARWIVGELAEVCANALTVVPERLEPASGEVREVDVDDVCSWLARLAGHAEGVFHASWASLPQPWGDLAVFGDRGALVWRRTDDQWPFAEVLGATVDRPALQLLPVPGRLVAGLEGAATWRECFMSNLVRRFVAEASRREPMEGATIADGFRVQLVLDAISTSLRERRWVAVSG
jgi:predicted dehydrogenase